MIVDKTEGFLDEVKDFAQRVGKIDDLQEKLDFLHNYANHTEEGNQPEENHKTRCLLFKDFAPYSFYFVMEIKTPRLSGELYCGRCNRVHQIGRDPFFIANGRMACPGCWESKHILFTENEYERYFNGGLIFHGSHDGYGSGEFPTLSVTVNPTDGWSIHT